jgi:hypothetical protein
MDGADFLAYVKQVLKRTDKDTEVYTAIADTIMDMRSRMLSDNFSYTATTPSGTLAVGEYKLSVPSDFGHLVGDISIRDSATDTVYNPLKRISKEEYDELYSQNLSSSASNRLTGVPLHYCYFGREIWLGPAVDKTTFEFTINYTTEDVPTITGATSEVQFTDQFREVVRAGTLFRIYFELGFTQEASNWASAYEGGIQKIIENDLFNSGSSSVGITYGGF